MTLRDLASYILLVESLALLEPSSLDRGMVRKIDQLSARMCLTSKKLMSG